MSSDASKAQLTLPSVAWADAGHQGQGTAWAMSVPTMSRAFMRGR